MIMNSAKCYICKKAYEEGEVKVKDHNPITAKYRESVAFHNFHNYDSRLIFQEVGKRNFKSNGLSKETADKFMVFTLYY